MLETAGLWKRLEPHAAALQIMRIIDAGGPEPEARLTKDFDASDISDAPFGWNLPNWLLRREMIARLAELPAVSFRPGTGFARMLTRQAAASWARSVSVPGSRERRRGDMGAPVGCWARRVPSDIATVS